MMIAYTQTTETTVHCTHCNGRTLAAVGECTGAVCCVLSTTDGADGD